MRAAVAVAILLLAGCTAPGATKPHETAPLATGPSPSSESATPHSPPPTQDRPPSSPRPTPSSPGPSPGPTRLSFGPRLEVSMPCACDLYEPTVAIDPSQRIAATTARASVMVLLDETGTQAKVPFPPFPAGSPANARGDNILDTAHARLYYSTLAVQAEGSDRRVVGIQVASTPDAGATWTSTYLDTRRQDLSVVSGDRQWLAFGPPGVVHLTYSEINVGLWFATSTDGGASFTEPVLVVGSLSRMAEGQAGPLAVDDRGLWLPSTDHGALGLAASRVVLRHSADGGTTWKPVPVAAGTGCATGANWFPVAASTPQGLVVAWVTGPGTDPPRKVCVTRTEDGGATWREPLVVGDEVAPGPWLLPGPAGVDVFWFDHAEGRPAGRFLRLAADWDASRAVEVAPGVLGENALTDLPHMARFGDGRAAITWSGSKPWVAVEARDP